MSADGETGGAGPGPIAAAAPDPDLDPESSPDEGKKGGGGADPAGSEPRSAGVEEGRARPSWAAVGIFLLGLVAGLAYAQAFLMPVLLAFLLALVFSPIRRAVCRRGLPPGWCAAAIVGGLTAALLLVVYLLASPVIGWLDDAPQIGARLEERIREIRTTLGGETGAASVREAVRDVADVVTLEPASGSTVVLAEDGPLERLAALVPTIAVQGVLVLVLLLFLIASGDMFYEKIVHVTPRFRDKRRAIRIARDTERRLSRYLLTITLINAGLGVAVGTAMWALGMPDPLLFGVIAWLFNYVPYVGALAGSALALVVGLLTFDGVWQALLPGLLYYGLTAVEGQFVTPWFVGRELKLNTVVVFVTIAFCAWLWSVVGMLIAVPVLVAIRTLCKSVPELEPVADFLSARGVEQDEEPSADPERRAESA